MSRRRPTLAECVRSGDMNFFVRGGFAQVAPAPTEAGPLEYGAGRNFRVANPAVVAGASIDLRADVAKAEADPGNNTDPTGVWTDISGNNHDVTLNTFAYTTASGWDGDGSAEDPCALVFDATNDSVSAAAIAFGAGDFTLEVWANVTAGVATAPLIGCYNGSYPWGGDPGYALWLAGGTPRIEVADGLGGQTDGNVATDLPDARGGMAHIVVTYDGAFLRYYANGAKSTNAVAFTAGTGTPAGSLLIGNSWLGALNGAIAAVRVYPSALSDGDVSQNYAVGPGKYTAVSVAYAALVTVDSSGATAAGGKFAYARNSSGSLYGPILVTDVEKTAGEQTATAALWHSPSSLFGSGLVASGDVLIPLGGDSRGYVKR